jgi:hypothetical protein
MTSCRAWQAVISHSRNFLCAEIPQDFQNDFGTAFAFGSALAPAIWNFRDHAHQHPINPEQHD